MKLNKDTFLHYREGKAQAQRFLDELNPNAFNLHDFDVVDWILFAYNFAKHINYFDKEGNSADGNWLDFVDHFKIKEVLEPLGFDAGVLPRKESISYKKVKRKVETVLSEFESNSNLTPHLGLFIAFIKLLGSTKSRFNDLTKRHLDFYYGEILKIKKNEPEADSVYVIFELAKKALHEKIPAGTKLDAKKDPSGKKRLYSTVEDLVANQTKVKAVKSFLNDPVAGELKMAPIANSIDGLGKELPEDTQFWWPFAYNSAEKDYNTLPDPEIGFSVASPLLALEESYRKVSVKLTYKNTTRGSMFSNGISKEDLESNIEILASGEKKWLSGIQLSHISDTARELILTFELSKDFPAIVNYNQEKLNESFETEFPVVRFLIKGSKQYAVYAALSEKEIKNVEVSVEVYGISNVEIENDAGKLNPKKPYYPFTSQPVALSNFEIKSPELFSKNWDTVNVTINWKDTPESFTKLYEAYVFDETTSVTKASFDLMDASTPSVVTNDNYFKASAYALENGEWRLKDGEVVLFQSNAISAKPVGSALNKINKSKIFEDRGFKALTSTIGSSQLTPDRVFQVNTVDDSSGKIRYQTRFSIQNSYDSGEAIKAIRLALNQSFMQDVYTKLYTLSLLSDKAKIIPNAPYIPLAESIEISYSAKENAYSYLQGANSAPQQNEQVQLYYEDVFGQYAQNSPKNLLTKHLPGGEFYIGLEANPNDQVSLLIQVLEGSENPLTETFEGKEKIEWEVLSGNGWTSLAQYILLDETSNFLKSGILRFKIPKHIDTNNTRLPKDLIWIRAVMDKRYDAVCKLKGVHTQAVKAKFENQENDLSHLESGLEAYTIGKLDTKVPQIKSVTQHYNSFGGFYEEADLQYYRRVSERLRHKNRAITQWDYEQLILQEFPEISKIKCLNHTSEDSFMSPGDVTLVLVPQIENKNAFDIYQPRVSRGKLNDIQTYINSRNTMHVNAIVQNPDYEEIEVSLGVKFFDKFDENFYSKQLEQDIMKYISPWAFSPSNEIIFEVNLNRNLLIDYLERLEYVDYIKDLNIYKLTTVRNKKEPVLQKKALINAGPKSILVSAKQHTINLVEASCKNKR